MFYSIDLDNMRFLHKHPRFDVIASLVHIEASNVSVLITSFDSKGSLRDFTIFELRKLILNTTGQSPQSTSSDTALLYTVYGLARALPVTDCVPEEVRRQSEWIKDADATVYRYVKGSAIPGVQTTGLFALQTPLAEHEVIFKEDPPVVTQDTQRVTEERAPRLRQKIAATTRPTEGVAAIIWNALDKNPALRNGPAIQEFAKDQGVQLMTAILQLAQWKKHQGGMQ